MEEIKEISILKIFDTIKIFISNNPYISKFGDFEVLLQKAIPSKKYLYSSPQKVEEIDKGIDKAEYEYTLRASQNEHPDVVVKSGKFLLGIECKTLATTQEKMDNYNALPCRKDLDYNSSVPCGFHYCKSKKPDLNKQKIRTYYAFAIYDREDDNKILSFMFVDGNYINNDYNLHKDHKNIKETGFGSYGDGFIRHRKMYVFPHPLTDEDVKGKTVIITSERFNNRKLIRKVKRIDKKKKSFIFYIQE